MTHADKDNSAPGFAKHPGYRLELIPCAKWVRVQFGGETIVDSTDADGGDALPEHDDKLIVNVLVRINPIHPVAHLPALAKRLKGDGVRGRRQPRVLADDGGALTAQLQCSGL